MALGLPPLPPAPGSPAGRGAADVLAEEHRRLAALCAALAEPDLPPRRRRDLADVLAATATRHLSAEAQYLYPAVRSAVPDEGPALADREVAATRDLLAALRAGEGAEGKLRRHAYATADLLDRLAAVASAEDLVRLGNRIETAEEAAPTRPHPGTPATAPWNKITDPAIGLLDRLRDAVTGRPTRAEDLTRRYASRLF
ncbi:hemerythrin domain-containing protein [Phytohabitans sp. ZYX-F-186]|uniref:Hemerythrin domain-containing protein n=1 Tax=Phytohabitans maris TaxID=3071409 RepID=A0ABU0ZID8_9ACTN|nr:hemerythrin domain-containing protein [Phytohabitans sp. ZYX-F-186]MDQ7906137.1 hemerythrin domain-containing protein [Phytohabitans sp. ZYX-F-186]